MTLYQVCQKINDYLEASNTQVLDYLIWSSIDKGNFIRTQSKKNKNPIKDKDIGEVKYIVLGMQKDFNLADYTFKKDLPNAQVQVFWCKRGLEVRDIVAFNNSQGYFHNIAIVVREGDCLDC